jgi:hypothetical protein
VAKHSRSAEDRRVHLCKRPGKAATSLKWSLGPATTAAQCPWLKRTLANPSRASRGKLLPAIAVHVLRLKGPRT